MSRHDSLGGADVTPAAGQRAADEYLDSHDLVRAVEWDTTDKSLTYHGHCHQKAIKRDYHADSILRRAGYKVDPLGSGCCRMSGTFGSETEHYSMSQAIVDILSNQIADSDGETVVASGGSCWTQLGDRTDSERPPHPAEALANALTANELDI
jgi:Fe-S oxidoreductase